MLCGRHLGPFVRQENVRRLSMLQEFQDVELSIVVNAFLVTVRVWLHLMQALLVVLVLLYPTYPTELERVLTSYFNVDECTASQKVYVLRHPASIIQWPQIVARLVIATNKQSENRRLLLASIVFVKLAKRLIFIWHWHGLHVLLVSEGLEVTAAKDEVNVSATLSLPLKQVFVHLIKQTVEAANDGVGQSFAVLCGFFHFVFLLNLSKSKFISNFFTY